MKKISFLLLLLFCSIASYAQFKGQVINAKGKPAKKIAVRLKNKSVSTVTDSKGLFTLQGITTEDTLVITASRKEDAIIPIGNMSDITVILQKDNFVVKSGNESYEKEYLWKKARIANDNIITREMIEESTATNIYDILRYNIQGVKVIDNTDGSKIIIRNSPLEPLFVIDGLYFESSAEADARVSASDIERIEILRDGEGYGYRGGNGVIVISTRK